VLSLSGQPNLEVRWISATVCVFIGVLYYAVRVPTARFGSYKQLLVIAALLNLSMQVVIVIGIAISAVTGTPNIFTAPEFGGTINPWIHIAAHLVFGTTVGSLVPWLIGSLLLYATKKLLGSDSKVKSMA